MNPHQDLIPSVAREAAVAERSVEDYRRRTIDLLLRASSWAVVLNGATALGLVSGWVDLSERTGPNIEDGTRIVTYAIALCLFGALLGANSVWWVSADLFKRLERWILWKSWQDQLLTRLENYSIERRYEIDQLLAEDRTHPEGSVTGAHRVANALITVSVIAWSVAVAMVVKALAFS